jgi:dienelactone hydrolase
MKIVPDCRAWKVRAAVALCLILTIAGVLPAAGNQPYEERKEEVKFPNRSIGLWCARPTTPRSPAFLVIFASGDGGLHGVSKAIYKHIAEQGYYVAAYSSREALARVKSTGKFLTFPEAASAINTLLREARRLLDLRDSTPTIVTGNSRGASMVVFAAAEPSLKAQICGAVAIALTRESDYVTPPAPAERDAYIKLDDKGGVLLYPALDRLGSVPIAVIQSTNDSYVRSAESRQLMGPDTPTRRLYEVQSSNHSFGGGKDQLLHDLDEALDWIASTIQSKGGSQ